MRKWPVVVLGTVLMLLASGCYRSDLTVKVNDDGSGTYTEIVAINPKAIAQLSKSFGDASGASGSETCQQMRDGAKQNQADLPSGAKVEDYTDGDFCGIKITASFAAGDNPMEQLSAVLSGLQSDSSTESGLGFDSFALAKDGTAWTFSANPSAGSGGTTGADASSSAIAKQFVQGASNIVRIKLPGRLVEKDSNPDRIGDDGTLIWNLNVLGDTRILKARTEPGAAITGKIYTDAGKNLPSIKGAGSSAGGTSSPTLDKSSGAGSSGGGSSKLPWIIGAGVLAAAVVGFVLWKRSKGSSPSLSPSMAGPAAMPMPMSAPGAPPVAPMPMSAPGAPPVAPMPMSAPVAAPAAAPGQPQWDPARNAYILYDAGSSKWLVYDNAREAWKPIDETP